MSCKIMYLRAFSGQPVGCIAMSYDKTNRVVKYQVSYLNPRDKFEKKVARDIALGRMDTKPVEVELDSYYKRSAPITSHDITKAVMNDISLKKSASSRASKAVNRWLVKHNSQE